ncbi:hypothetical protein IWQ62_000552 [Dispira parvispora]|uniref:Uncharacterized protein n=1 Tax=Dispira parvispora TaxID=1520584 RepID=A0A9W8AUG8_9FUNG|nr:hypothetical protein IWQ62_000552 [Dispira parvispora]
MAFRNALTTCSSRFGRWTNMPCRHLFTFPMIFSQTHRATRPTNVMRGNINSTVLARSFFGGSFGNKLAGMPLVMKILGNASLRTALTELVQYLTQKGYVKPHAFASTEPKELEQTALNLVKAMREDPEATRLLQVFYEKCKEAGINPQEVLSSLPTLPKPENK